MKFRRTETLRDPFEEHFNVFHYAVPQIAGAELLVEFDGIDGPSSFRMRRVRKVLSVPGAPISGHPSVHHFVWWDLEPVQELVIQTRKEVPMAKKKATKPAPLPFAPKAKKGGKVKK